MSQDPSALAAFTALARHEAEYDAVYAAVTATERGRWFLSEYANRIRKADTDLVVAALARIEAAIGGGAVPQTSLSSAGFTEAVPAGRIAAAAERLADLCFRLRESAADAALCDDIEAAAQEIYQACGTANRATAAAAVSAADDEAQTELAGASDGAPPISAMHSGMTIVGAADGPDITMPALDDDAGRLSPVPPAADEAPRWHIEGPDFLFQPGAPEPDRQGAEPADRAEQTHALLPETAFEPEEKDDPAALFEHGDPVGAASAASAPESDVQISVRNEPLPETPQPALRVIASQAVRPLSRPASNDMHEPIGDLSEEELIALFG